MINGHAIHLGVDTLTATNTNAELVVESTPQPVLNLEGTWTSQGHSPMVVTNGETPFEYLFSIPQVVPGDPLITGFVKLDEVMPEKDTVLQECVNQKVFCT